MYSFTQAMNSKSKHLEVGKAGEFLAMVFLKKKGLRLLNMNWRWHRLEVDLIMKEKNTLVFVEVKTRTNAGSILPEDAVNHKKMQKISKTRNFQNPKWLRFSIQITKTRNFKIPNFFKNFQIYGFFEHFPILIFFHRNFFSRKNQENIFWSTNSSFSHS